MALNASEKFGVSKAIVPREVHVEPSGDDAYSIALPLYQKAQWVPVAESTKLLRAAAVVEEVELDAPTTATCACATDAQRAATVIRAAAANKARAIARTLDVAATAKVATQLDAQFVLKPDMLAPGAWETPQTEALKRTIVLFFQKLKPLDRIFQQVATAA